MIVQSELSMAWRFFVIKPFPHSVLVISVSVQNLNSNNKPLIENYSVKISHCNKMWPYLGLISVFITIIRMFIVILWSVFFPFLSIYSHKRHSIIVSLKMLLVFVSPSLSKWFFFFGMTNHCSNLWRLLNALIYFVDCWPNETEQNQNKFDEISQIEFSKIEIENKKNIHRRNAD